MNTEQEHALLPCPFCGGKPSISKQMGESLWSHDIVLWTQVQCDECEAHVGPTCEGFEVEAVDIWNRRAAPQSQDREDAAQAEWMACESRRPWVTNSLKHHIKELRDAEKRSRNAFKKDYMGEPARYFADACGEAAAVFEAKLTAIDHARRIEGET